MVLYLLLSLPAYAVQSNPDVASGIKLALCLFAPCAFNFGAYTAVMAEGTGAGVTWANLYDTAVTPLGLSFGQILGMIVLDAVLYMFLAWYLDKVWLAHRRRLRARSLT